MQGSIDFEAFIQGMALCCRGSEEKRLRFLFSLYDLNGDGLLDKAELVSMVLPTQMYNTYKHTMRGSPNSEASDGAEESKEVVSIRDTRELSPRGSQLMTPDLSKKVERKSSAALLKRDDFGTKEKVSIFVDKILADLHAETVLDYEKFVKFGLEITHQFGGFKEVTMWCGSEEERNEWRHRLVQAAKTRKVEEYYEFKEKRGTGKFSDVFMAVELSSNLQWAVKVVDKKRLSEQEREMMRSEVAIMRLLNHNNVVQMKEVFEDKQKMYLIMELVEGGELFDRIRQKKVLSEYTSFFIARQLLDAVKYLHEVGIVHRDIKPENILLTDDSEIPTIKLADFGLSKLVGPNDTLRTACGTLAYVAPEVLMQRPYSKPVDLWSIGIVTYLMLRGRLPFDSKDRHILIQKTIEANLDLSGPYWDKLTPYAIDFLQKTIQKDTQTRLTVDQALNHAWIHNGDVLIPRKINKKTMEEELLRKTLTSVKMDSSIYTENPKAMTLEPPNSDAPGPRVIFSTPDIYEDMEVIRRPAEQSLAIQLS